MSSNNENSSGQKKPSAIYEPGELEKTRKNIGKIDKTEAQRMMQRLGGEVGIEKSVPFDPKTMPQKNRVYVSKRSSSTPISTTQLQHLNEKKPALKVFELPVLTSKDKATMDEIFITFSIKPKYNFLVNLINIVLNRNDRISPEFISSNLHSYTTSIITFSRAVQKMTSVLSDKRLLEIEQDNALYNRTIKKISKWDWELALKIEAKFYAKPNEITEVMLQPLIKCVFTLLYPLFFLGEEKTTSFIKQLYSEAIQIPKVKPEVIQSKFQDAASSCLYIFNQVYKGLYPLLMRMCCTEITTFPEIFTTNSPEILKFLGLSKYDVLFPEKNKPIQKVEEPVKPEVEEQKEEETVVQKRELVQRGLTVLNTLFPDAGWDKIDTMPDMYPYFQSIYQYKEAFSYIAPDNPMQVTVILLSILDDFFTGCRYISFDMDLELTQSLGSDKVQVIIDQWGEYHNNLYEREYESQLKNLMNNIYSNSSYSDSQFGKKEISNLLWYAHNYFLPYLSFDLRFLDRPKADNTLLPLYRRVDTLEKTLSIIIRRADLAYNQNATEALESDTLGARKLWDRYQFPMPNAVSKRLDVLLGGKKAINASNINLLKYTTCVLAVLNWWIGDKNSPAYFDKARKPYRTSSDGTPVFSIPLIENANELFIKNLKKSISKE